MERSQLKEEKDQEGNDHRVLQNFPVFAYQGGLYETEVASVSTDGDQVWHRTAVSVKHKNVRWRFCTV